MIRTAVRAAAASAAAMLLSACVGSQVSVIPVSAKATVPINVIALDPGGGLLADAVGVQLSNKGYTVIDSADTSKMLARLNVSEVEIQQPVGLAKLKDQGVDAMLRVRAAAAYDGQPQSASARVNTTADGKIVAGVTWQNGWGGQAGSIADRSMRKGLSEASVEIADALVQSLPVPAAAKQAEK